MRFGLTKVLLAEGDAPFPFVRHRNISLRRNPPVEKNNDAGAERQRELQETKTQSGGTQRVPAESLNGISAAIGSLGCKHRLRPH